jgi:beta-galactosidase
MTNFGAGDVEYGFHHLAELGQRGPPMAGEYWAGWFDVWGEPHHTQILEKMMADLGWMLDRGYSFNLYMVHGGTTFGWMGGARMSER